MNLNLILVTWVDSRRSTDEIIQDNEDFENFPLAIIETIGYGKILKDKIVMSTEYYPEIAHIQCEQTRGIYSIPIACVKNITELMRGKNLKAHG